MAVIGLAMQAASLTMVGPQVLTVSFVSSTHDQLTLAGIGGNESTEVTCKVAGLSQVRLRE